MPTDQHSTRLRIFINHLSEPVLQVFLKRRVFYDRNHQSLIVTEIPPQLLILYTLYHLQVRAAKFFSRKEQGGHDGCLRVGMDNGTCISRSEQNDVQFHSFT